MKQKTKKLLILIILVMITIPGFSQAWKYVYNPHTGRLDIVNNVTQVTDTIFIGNDTIYISSGSGLWYGNATDSIWSDSLAKVGIRTADPQYPFDVNGSVLIKDTAFSKSLRLTEAGGFYVGISSHTTFDQLFISKTTKVSFSPNDSWNSTYPAINMGSGVGTVNSAAIRFRGNNNSGFGGSYNAPSLITVSYTHLRAHET